MNQRVMKRVKGREAAFYRDQREAPNGPPESAGINGPPLFDEIGLSRLTASGVYGNGPEAELAAIIHEIGSTLNRIRPLQAGRA